MSTTPNDHGHGHAHDADAPKGGAPAAAVEDASTQALSEALRSSFNVVKLLMAALVAAFLISGVFTVRPNEVAIRLWFGRPMGVGPDQLLQPGLHWKLPYPIMDLVRIPVGESHTVTSTSGWYYLTPEEELARAKPPSLGFLRPGVDGYTLTGDGNIIHVQAILSYRISDPVNYAFNFANATNLLQHLLDNALNYASCRFTADDALRNKLGFQEAVLNRVNETTEKLKLGVTIEPREVLIAPPIDVEKAFSDVLSAQQKGDQKIQEAETYARIATNGAAGDAAAIIRGGVTRSNYLVQTVAAEAKQFNDLLPRYQADPQLFKQRLLADSMQRILTNAQFKVFLPERADGKLWDVRLQLSKEPEIPKKETPKP